MSEFKEYFLRVEAFAIANNIDLHGAHDGTAMNKFFLNFENEDHLLLCAKNNIIPLCDRDTGDATTCPIDELKEEMAKPDKGPGLIVAALLGAAAVFAAKKVRDRSTVSQRVETERSLPIEIAG